MYLLVMSCNRPHQFPGAEAVVPLPDQLSPPSSSPGCIAMGFAEAQYMTAQLPKLVLGPGEKTRLLFMPWL